MAMAKVLAIAVGLSALVHVLTAAVIKEDLQKALTRKSFAHLEADIEEWKRLGKPTQAAFQHTANSDVQGLLIDMPETTALFGTNIEANIFYYLFTRANVDNGTLVAPTSKAFLEAGWKSHRPTKIIVHGFTNDITSVLFSTLVPAIMEKGDYNVIAVDWGNLCKAPFYIEARSRVGAVGKEVAKLIDMLVLEAGLNLRTLHLMGHSLGAHIVGNAGRAITTGKIARTTGLDPALPLFLILTSDRLRRGDADLVDVVHSCGGFLGLTEAVGDVDFYPNGGTWPQPGCGADLVGTCSHGRGVEFIAESAYEPGSFPATECSTASNAESGKDCSKEANGNLGFDLRFNRTGSGTYYLETATTAPYDPRAHKKAQKQAEASTKSAS